MLKTYLQYGSTFYGVAHSSVQGRDTLHAFGLKKKRDAFKPISQEQVEDIEGLRAALPKVAHLSLVVNNDQVLIKKIPRGAGEDAKKLRQAFPNLRQQDFYYQIYEGTHSFVAICRRDHIDGIMQKYEEAGFSVVDCTLGPFVLDVVLPLFTENTIVLPGLELQLQEGQIEELRKGQYEERTYHLDEEGLKSSDLLPFSSIIHQFAPSQRLTDNLEERVSAVKQQYLQKRFFGLFFKGALAFLFVVLLLNFLLFSHYNSEVEVLREAFQVNEVNKEKILKLKEEVDRKKKMVNDMMASASSKSSFYFDRVVADMPSTVTLDKMEYQPVRKRIKDGEAIAVDANRILVAGVSIDSEKYGKWYDMLESMEWVEGITITEYSDTGGSKTNFTLLLLIGP